LSVYVLEQQNFNWVYSPACVTRAIRVRAAERIQQNHPRVNLRAGEKRFVCLAASSRYFFTTVFTIRGKRKRPPELGAGRAHSFASRNAQPNQIMQFILSAAHRHPIPHNTYCRLFSSSFWPGTFLKHADSRWRMRAIFCHTLQWVQFLGCNNFI